MRSNPFFRATTYAFGAWLDLAMAPAASRLTRAHDHRPHPLPDPPVFGPLGPRRRFGLVHYNVVVPDLPAPHRFLACTVMMGQSGTRVFDADHAIVHSPRDTATVAVGTAATAPASFGAYSISEDCDLRDDGSLLRFGDVLVLRATFPAMALSVRFDGFDLDIDIRCTEDVTWFARSLMYDHLGIPARYAGTLRFGGTETKVAGLCSFEHAQCVTPVAVLDRPLPSLLKLPVDRFAYHVLKLDDDTLLLLTQVEVAGRPVLATAFVKTLDGEQMRCFEGVRCAMGVPRPDPLVAPDGSETNLPSGFHWSFGDPETDGLDVELTPDTPLIYGLGHGWMGGAAFRGRFRGADVSGRAYYEHADRR